DEAFALLERYGADARLLAGGQSLVPALNMRLAMPAALVDINRLPGLDAIRLAPEGLVIGALARQEAALRSPLVARARTPVALRAPAREIPAAQFSRGIYTTALEPGEILTGVVIPPLGAGWRSHFSELARRHGDYALLALAAQRRLSDGSGAEGRL